MPESGLRILRAVHSIPGPVTACCRYYKALIKRYLCNFCALQKLPILEAVNGRLAMCRQSRKVWICRPGGYCRLAVWAVLAGSPRAENTDRQRVFAIRPARPRLRLPPIAPGYRSKRGDERRGFIGIHWLTVPWCPKPDQYRQFSGPGLPNGWVRRCPSRSVLANQPGDSAVPLAHRHKRAPGIAFGRPKPIRSLQTTASDHGLPLAVTSTAANRPRLSPNAAHLAPCRRVLSATVPGIAVIFANFCTFDVAEVSRLSIWPAKPQVIEAGSRGRPARNGPECAAVGLLRQRKPLSRSVGPSRRPAGSSGRLSDAIQLWRAVHRAPPMHYRSPGLREDGPAATGPAIADQGRHPFARWQRRRRLRSRSQSPAPGRVLRGRLRCRGRSRRATSGCKPGEGERQADGGDAGSQAFYHDAVGRKTKAARHQSGIDRAEHFQRLWCRDLRTGDPAVLRQKAHMDSPAQFLDQVLRTCFTMI